MVAIIVPDRPILEKWAAENQIPVEGDSGYLELLKDPRTIKAVQDEIVSKSREAKFFGFEIPQKIHLTATNFTPENDILTPTFKLKRNEAKKAFFKEIKDMYGGAKLQGEE